MTKSSQTSQTQSRLTVHGLPPLMPQVFAETSQTRIVAIAADTAITHNGIALIDGPPGMGKTVAAYHAAKRVNVPCAFISVAHDPAPNDILRMLSRVIPSATCKPNATRNTMEQALLQAMPVWGGLIIVDEAQYLRERGVQMLRYLLADGASNCSMLLTGWNAATMIGKHPDLDSRILIRHTFRALEDNEVIEFVRETIPSLAHLTDDEIMAVNAAYTHGQPRRWNKISLILATVTKPKIKQVTNACVLHLGAA